MKRSISRWGVLCMAVALVCIIVACGSDKTKDTSNEGKTVIEQYQFLTEGENGKVSIATDMEAEPVIEALGEPLSYFEAPSCAFDGLDKVYTYTHFEIDTYPLDGKDFISEIVLLDDLVETPEGLAIGMKKEDMERIYGTDYEENVASCIYYKNDVKFTVIFDRETVSSIYYESSVLSSK